jgi:hypothetical protein
MNKKIKILLFSVTVILTVCTFHVFGKRMHAHCQEHFKGFHHCSVEGGHGFCEENGEAKDKMDHTYFMQKHGCEMKDTTAKK